VTLSPYFLSKYEMTQGQWLAATGTEPSIFSRNRPQLDPSMSLLHPVEMVSWRECMRTMRQLGLELPTEAQWESGCRAGTKSAWWLGDERESLRGLINIADKTAADEGAPWSTIQDWPDNEDGALNQVEVGCERYPANAYGLHEVHGNLQEWCLDGWAPPQLFYTEEQRIDPLVPWQDTPNRAIRGGAFNTPAYDVRSAARQSQGPDLRDYSLGLRPARGITAGSLSTSPERGR